MKYLECKVLTTPSVYEKCKETPGKKGVSSLYVKLGTNTLIRSERWWLEDRNGTTFDYRVFGARVPLHMLRWANESFWLDMDAPKELQIIWDKKTSRFHMEKTSAVLTRARQIPIIRLFPFEPDVLPLGVYGICFPPRGEADLYRIEINANVGGKIYPLGIHTIFD